MRLRNVLLILGVFTATCKTPDKKIALPFYNTPDFTPIWLTSNDAGYKNIHTISSFAFTNQLGQTVTNATVAGKIYVANFFFTSCASICPQMMSNLVKVETAFVTDTNVIILSHSVTPTRDNVPILLKYAHKNHNNSKNWWLLTGDKAAIYQLARQSYFAEDVSGYKKGTNEFLHTENLVLIDRKGRIRGIYNGSLRLEVDNLITHIKLLAQEN